MRGPRRGTVRTGQLSEVSDQSLSFNEGEPAKSQKPQNTYLKVSDAHIHIRRYIFTPSPVQGADCGKTIGYIQASPILTRMPLFVVIMSLAHFRLW